MLTKLTSYFRGKSSSDVELYIPLTTSTPASSPKSFLDSVVSVEIQSLMSQAPAMSTFNSNLNLGPVLYRSQQYLNYFSVDTICLRIDFTQNRVDFSSKTKKIPSLYFSDLTNIYNLSESLNISVNSDSATDYYLFQEIVFQSYTTGNIHVFIPLSTWDEWRACFKQLRNLIENSDSRPKSAFVQNTSTSQPSSPRESKLSS